ncbi:MAG: hypothetical protein WC043_05890 [Pseudobdellovibrionaceae bacterium]
MLGNASSSLAAAPAIPFTVTMSEAVNISGTPRIVLDVGGNTRYATYSAGTGTSSLTFTYTATIGDLDLDGLSIASATLDLNGGSVTDLNGNPETNLSFVAPANMSSVKVGYPSLSLDFVADADGRYTLNGTAYNDLTSFLSAAGGTFSRPSIATYFDSTGTLQTAASNTPRFDYDPTTHAAKGILIEESRTNYVKNSQFSGIPVGTSSSTGSWQLSYGSPPGSSISVTGTGTQNGIPYIDIRYLLPTNTTGGTQWPSFGMLFSDAATVSAGATTIFSSWFGITSYSSTGGTCTIGYSNRSYTSGGAYVSEATTSFTSTASYAYRISPVMTHGATAGKAYFAAYVAIPNGASCDITVRLGGPQFELGSFPTSLIPTTSATVTRAADSFHVSTGSWTSVSGGTIYARADYGGLAWPPDVGGVFALNDNTTSNRVDLRAGQMSYFIDGGGSGSTNFPGSFSFAGGLPKKFAITYSASVLATSFEGAAATNATPVLPSGLSRLWVGNIDSGVYWLNGHVAAIKYYPNTVSNTQLQLLTQ